MLDTLQHLAVAARGVEHLAEWTGLSAGALIVLAAIAYVNPATLRVLIPVAVGIGLLYGGTLYGNHTGRSDVEARWADARKAAIAAASERDAMTEATLQAKYQPQLEALQKQSDERKQQVDDYESKILKLMSAKPAAARTACDRRLGAAAFRLRGRQ